MTGTDYQSLIDAETWAFIARTDASYPPDAAQLDIAGQRRVYDAMCAAFAQAYPQGITAKDEVIAGIPCRRYTGAKPAIVYFHGG
ncbi:MAG: esterase, partial [Cypionkella sp.]